MTIFEILIFIFIVGIVSLLWLCYMNYIFQRASQKIQAERERQWRKACIKTGISQKEIERLYLERRSIEVTGW